jgi:hypothetical protein
VLTEAEAEGGEDEAAPVAFVPAEASGESCAGPPVPAVVVGTLLEVPAVGGLGVRIGERNGIIA